VDATTTAVEPVDVSTATVAGEEDLNEVDLNEVDLNEVDLN